MFIHLFYYRLKKIFRSKVEIFWMFLFPIILGTMFYFAFGNLYESTEIFNVIPVAYVDETDTEQPYFDAFLDAVSAEGDNQLLVVSKTTKEEAVTMLENKDVTGIIYHYPPEANAASSNLSLSISENGIEQSILKAVLDQYLQTEATIQTMITEKPEMQLQAVLQVLNSISDDRSFLKEIQYSSGTMDIYCWYFFALLAMNCMYGCFAGVTGSISLKAKTSSLGARRSVSPTNRMKMILADYFATVLVQFLSCSICLAYLIFVLGINFGNKYALILLTCFIGCMIGVSIGWLIGSIGKMQENTKISMSTGVSMISCFLSGLMVANMKDILEQYAPIVNKINPATLLCDAFYSLNIYDTYERFTTNLITLLIMAVILCFCSFLAIRKDSI